MTQSCPEFAELCDDFETGDLSMWSGQTSPIGGSTSVDTIQVFEGSFALAATVPTTSTDGAAASLCKQVPSGNTGMLAVRFWIYLPQAPLNNQGFLFVSDLATCVRKQPLRYITVGCDPEMRWKVEEATAAQEYFRYLGSPCLTAATWTCVELNYTFDGPGRLEIFANNARVVDAVPSAPPIALSEIEVGVTRASAAGYQAFVDNVVVARQHIGCR